jgi:hypothetical protein
VSRGVHAMPAQPGIALATISLAQSTRPAASNCASRIHMSANTSYSRQNRYRQGAGCLSRVRAVSFPGRILLFAKAKERLSRFLNIRSENYPGESQAASRFDDALNGDVGFMVPPGNCWPVCGAVLRVQSWLAECKMNGEFSADRSNVQWKQ